MNANLITIKIEADSLEEARDCLRARLTDNTFVVSEEIITYGGAHVARASAATIDAAFALAEEEIPDDATILERRRLCDPTSRTVTIHALNERSALTRLNAALAATETIRAVRRVAAGREGFLGLGRQPAQYVAEVTQPARVEVTYKRKARMAAKIGCELRCGFDKGLLDAAERSATPVDVACEICGRTCSVFAGRPADGADRVLTPGMVEAAARYCEKDDLVVCGACVSASTRARGLHLGGRPCPRCGADTVFATVAHLRMTTTPLL